MHVVRVKKGRVVQLRVVIGKGAELFDEFGWVDFLVCRNW